MRITDLVRSKDGSLSLTKLAASCAHLAFFLTVVYITILTGEFKLEMWTLYVSVTITHAIVDKAMATAKNYKDRQLEATYGGPEHDQ